MSTQTGTAYTLQIDLDDGRVLDVNITHEGIIMDVFRNMEHLGTAGMMFDEWADWIVVDEETTDIDRKRP